LPPQAPRGTLAAMTTDTRTLWISRAALPNGPGWLRVITDGPAPGPDDTADAIA
jgi:hypothetical protein